MKVITVAWLLLVLPSLSFGAAQKIYYGGPIITMDRKHPLAEVVVVRGDTITYVGRLKTAKNSCANNSNCEFINLRGKTLMPGFIDALGHYSMTLKQAGYENLSSPPIGKMKSITGIIARLKFKQSHKDWIIGVGYDNSLLRDKRHLNRKDLDKISTTKPVYVKHASGHIAVCNTVCLRLAGIDENTVDPEGGVIQRDKNSGQANGILEERAMDLIKKLLPAESLKTRLSRIPELNNYYAQYGVTTIMDGATSDSDLDVLLEASKRNLFTVDIVSYPFYNWVDLNYQRYQPIKDKRYNNHFRIAGIKLVLDGSPQGKTAWLSKPYFVPPKGQNYGYAGYSMLSDDKLKRALTDFYVNDWQVMAHANGDAAIEQLLNAIDELKQEGVHQPRSVLVHAQTARDDQLARMNELDVIPSFFASHSYYWGDWHRDSVFGRIRAERLNPLHSAKLMGIPYTIHNDTPITPPNMPLLIWSASNRITRTGKVLGKGQRARVFDALKAVTINAAYQLFEEDSKGSFRKGKVADMVILDRDPLTIKRNDIKNMRVLETIKSGKTVYLAKRQ